MTNTIALLLPEKGRPLFAGKTLLERIQFNTQYNRYSEAYFIKKEEIRANIIALKTFASILLTLNAQRIKKDKEIYDLLIDFPLFLDQEFVHNWENEKPWKKYRLESHVLNGYEDIINGQSPSLAYSPSESGYSNRVWEQFFINSDANVIIDIIQKSIVSLENYLSEREDKEVSVLEKNIYQLKETFSLCDEDVFTLYWTNTLFDSNLSHVNKVWVHALELFQYNTQLFFNLIESRMGVPDNTMLYRLTAKKPLVSLFFYESLSITNKPHDILKENQPQNWSTVWNNIATDLLKDNIRIDFSLEHKTILDNLIHLEQSEKLPLESWDYLNGILNIWKAQLGEGNTKILFHGLKGCGKTSLALSLLKTLNFEVYSPVKDDIEHLVRSVIFTNYLPKSALIIEGHKEFLKESKFLEYCKSNLIYNVENITDIPKDILDHFDYVYDLSDIPFDVRLAYSKTLFENSNLAIKIAQQLKTFGSIKKASSLVSNETDWKTIYPHVNIEKGKIGEYFHVLDHNSFKDIPVLAGYDTLYDTFNNILDLFENPHKYEQFSAKVPKGLLIEGAPGTGKTLFVKHIAKKTQLPLIVANSPQLANNLDGVAEIFNFARMSAPCILFFDEIDTLLINPDTPFGKDSRKQQLLNTMLSEIDGIKSLTGVLIVGTTNYYHQISPIALRSGRLSETVSISVPNSKDRSAIWESYLSSKPTENIDYTNLAKMSGGFSGADIAEAANQSALLAAYENSNVISLKHINKACEIITLGRPNHQLFVDPLAMNKTAVHEVGHALMAIHHGVEVNRVTIVPRQGALGVTSTLEKEGFYCFSKDDLKNKISIFLGGIIAEQVIFGSFESGGSSDLDVIYKKIYQAYSKLGFSDIIGPIGSDINNWSEHRKIQIEKESTDLVNLIFKKTLDLLTAYKPLIDSFSKELLEHKSLSIEDITHWKEELDKLKTIKVS
jgi:cell division protease FtsH